MYYDNRISPLKPAERAFSIHFSMGVEQKAHTSKSRAVFMQLHANERWKTQGDSKPIWDECSNVCL